MRQKTDVKNSEGSGLQPQVALSHVIYQTRSPETGQGRILVPLSNPKTANVLLEMAVAIARDRHYEIECLHVIVVPHHQSPTEATVSTVTGQRLLQSAMELAQVWHIPIHTQIRVAHDLSSAILQSIKERHIDLVLMGWKGKTTTPERIFSRAVDTIIRQAPCSVVLVKLSSQSHFDRWLVPIAGGPNAQEAIQLLPTLATLSKTPEIKLCQVFAPDKTKPDTTTLEKATYFLKQHFNGAVTTALIRSSSISDAVLDCAKKNHSEVIILGASREGMLQQVLHGNIPAAISQSNDQTGYFYPTPRKGKIRLTAVDSICCKPKLSSRYGTNARGSSLTQSSSTTRCCYREYMNTNKL